MADLPSVNQKIQDTEVFKDAPLTESLHTNYGQFINYLLDTVNDQETRVNDLNRFEAAGESGNINFGGNRYIVNPIGGLNPGPDLDVARNSISPQTADVLVNVSGMVHSDDDFTLNLRRNGVIVNTFTSTAATRANDSIISIGGFLSFIDNAATPDVTNTYRLEVFTGTQIVYLYAPCIQLIGMP